MTPEVSVLEEHTIDRRPGRRARVLWLAFGLLVVLIPIGVSRMLRGHRVDARFAPNHGGESFDFVAPPCEPAARPATVTDDDLLIRYLGVSGLLIEWRSHALLTAPYFSTHGLLAAEFGEAGWDDVAVAEGAAWIDGAPVAAVLVGHSHFDHLADLPPLLLDHLPGVPAYVNRSGAKMLAAFDPLDDRVHEVEPLEGRWVRLQGADGTALPIRFKPLAAGHAGHVLSYHYAPGEVDQEWSDWQGRKFSEMREGVTFAFLIDLLEADGETVRYRIHVQDAASDAPLGFPDPADIERHPVDLAVICMPSWWKVEDYPAGLLRHGRARHALITHYEDFFRPRSGPIRFVPLLTDGRAERFLEQVDGAIPESTVDAGAQPRPCGPAGPRWTMPLPGEWLRYPAPAARQAAGVMLRRDEQQAQGRTEDLQGDLPAAGQDLRDLLQ